MKRTLLLMLGLVVGALAACNGDNSVSQLIAGSAVLQGFNANMNGLATTTFTHTFSQPFQNDPSVGFGIWDASFGASSAQQFSQFSIVASQTNRASVKFSFSHVSRVWTAVRIGFWATMRPDLLAGSASAEFQSLTSSSSATNVQTGSIANYQSSIIRAYINGVALNAGSTGIDVQVEGRNVSPNGVTIVTMVGSQTNVRKIWFSYIVFSPSEVGYASYGGIISESSFTGTGIKNIRNGINMPNYPLQGLTKLNSGFSVGITSNIDSDFVYSYSVTGAPLTFSFSYVMIGTTLQAICSTCPENYAYDSQCVNQCPAGTFAQSFLCRRCSSKLNLVINQAQNGCVCASGYQMVDGVCTSAITNSNSFGSQSMLGSFGSSNFGSSNFGSSNFGSFSTPATTTTTTQVSPVITPPASNSNSYQPFTNTVPQVVPVITTPTAPTTPTTTTAPTDNSPSNAFEAKSSQSCLQFSNTYWTGYRCACKVGYRLQFSTGNCQRLTLIVTPTTNPTFPTNCGQNAFFNGTACVCSTGYERAANGSCVSTFFCPEFSQRVGDACVCIEGYKRNIDICIPDIPVPCPPNSHRNSLGVCVCDTGYVNGSQGICIPDQQCPPNQVVSLTGTCVCISGFYRNNLGFCVRCQNGAVWNGSACVYACGINEEYNQILQICQCRPGYGKLDGICSVCTLPYFLKNGFCVTCPNNAQYDPILQCKCKIGFHVVSGFCIPICTINENFDAATQTCKCAEGLGYISPNVCGICPNGLTPNPTTQQCGSCGANQQLSNTGSCVCLPGFGRGQNGACVDCEATGGFLFEGFCVRCPGNKIWNANTFTCVCPAGQTDVSGICQAQCGVNQLTDAGGNCYSCPLNEVPSNGVCICKTGYTRITSGLCSLSCPAGRIQINGRCGSCAPGFVYNADLMACVCPEGRVQNIQGSCQLLTLPPVGCGNSQYFDSSLGCLSCPAGCLSCQNANTCTSCINPSFVPSGNICSLPCGNGIKAGTEGCDDGNIISGDGCSQSCMIEDGFTCSGSSPSTCRPKPTNNCGNGQPNTGQACDDNNKVSGDGCSSTCQIEDGYICSAPQINTPSQCSLRPSGISLVSPTFINTQAVYVTVATDTVFTFNNQAEMKQFMKFRFEENAYPSSSYCTQKVFQPAKFDCLFLYPSGVPLFTFEIGLYYNHQGKSGQISFPVDYRTSTLATRSLK